MYLISGNITSNVTGNLPVITGNGNIGNITSNFRTLRRRMVGGGRPLLPEILGQLAPVGAKSSIFNQ